MRSRSLPTIAAAVAGCVLMLTGGVADADADAMTTCGNVTVPVAVGGQSGAIAGTLCAPPGATSLQILVPGLTYNRAYFDVAVEPDTYSYARAANRAGYATLAIDRLGAGQSLHPLSLFDTFEADVATLHEVVRAARGGAFGTAYPKVVTVGHSLGSILAQGEAGAFGDVDAIITTGFSSMLNYVNATARVTGHVHPATSDPRFADSGLDPLYFTTIPGTRAVFTNPENTEPALDAYDEDTLKDTDTLTELATFAEYPFANAIANIHVPVLAVTGTDDPIFCGLDAADCTSPATLQAHERAFYSAGNTVEAYAVPGTGHDVELATTAPLAHQRMIQFSDTYVGAGNGARDTEPGARPQPAPVLSGTPPLAARLADQAFLVAVAPLADEYAQIVQPVPGLGDTTDPSQSGPVLGRIAALAGQFASPLAQTALGGG